MVSGQIFIAGIACYVLIDLGSTYSIVTMRTVDRFNRPYDMHIKGFGTMLPTREVVTSRKWTKALPMRVDGMKLYEDFMEFTLKAGKMLQLGCMGFLASVVNTAENGTQRLEDTIIVRDFIDVFVTELLGFPPHREIEFTIELAPDTMPISKSPYKMTPFKELKVKLEELFDLGFIRPSYSP
ncbi:uncharacterized protein LOC133824559 [Humulus lupulus]|uniref:uncharacterized protein LOC133824559 n=1 Tax=Humulus lupulus TaxID=3486 RepID=UPI002B40C46B|nr:uncharacterized protein LOC133824559 [Humulus lupulus]